MASDEQRSVKYGLLKGQRGQIRLNPLVRVEATVLSMRALPDQLGCLETTSFLVLADLLDEVANGLLILGECRASLIEKRVVLGDRQAESLHLGAQRDDLEIGGVDCVFEVVLLAGKRSRRRTITAEDRRRPVQAGRNIQMFTARSTDLTCSRLGLDG
jgi:hypothetical protein